MPQSTALPATPSRRQGASVNPAEPRAARTHEALTSALFELLRQHDLTEISISELCRTAGVHRTTFYGHYADIFAFAADSFAHILDELGTVREGTFDGYSPEAVTEVYADSIRRELGHIVDHRAAYRMMFGTRVDAGFRRELYQRALRRAALAIAVWQRHGYGTGIDTTTAAAYIAGGSVGVLEAWAFSESVDTDAHTDAVMASWPAWCASAAPTEALIEKVG
ncbi:TetR/AcrR family transcriptional regulator [Herbiconiux sp. VKM Ac-1786]|uniref:TetR/AcrR family transcriptional regulator n=1 Tax=Herbiconiux sp. VKM Ac-1786 TaxID=2783824 RepID=UPI00188A247B|nr:TetR/AcrR family transcriptional regulator [Herbiconiux sp. VKM Ac-1786]MBF4573061.1 TetR/AcrR family transcriptional regulator [Herbiconiux sp. VKM Ac-1786]